MLRLLVSLVLGVIKGSRIAMISRGTSSKGGVCGDHVRTSGGGELRAQSPSLSGVFIGVPPTTGSRVATFAEGTVTSSFRGGFDASMSPPLGDRRSTWDFAGGAGLELTLLTGRVLPLPLPLAVPIGWAFDGSGRALEEDSTIGVEGDWLERLLLLRVELPRPAAGDASSFSSRPRTEDFTACCKLIGCLLSCFSMKDRRRSGERGRRRLENLRRGQQGSDNNNNYKETRKGEKRKNGHQAPQPKQAVFTNGRLREYNCRLCSRVRV